LAILTEGFSLGAFQSMRQPTEKRPSVAAYRMLSVIGEPTQTPGSSGRYRIAVDASSVHKGKWTTTWKMARKA